MEAAKVDMDKHQKEMLQKREEAPDIRTLLDEEMGVFKTIFRFWLEGDSKAFQKL